MLKTLGSRQLGTQSPFPNCRLARLLRCWRGGIITQESNDTWKVTVGVGDQSDGTVARGSSVANKNISQGPLGHWQGLSHGGVRKEVDQVKFVGFISIDVRLRQCW